ncbi:CoA transferase [Bosea caraganae]|uniref:CoA transferase n=1 Tax=Bosea caraganae TaxID=2763117 RepID=A0A370KY54_9HYPH|nr:CoA transferase [Bosea caraganae]RDJ19910.1 CoA transferase [Bosea caraganae]RDJ23848.1 CoA transferase [Bosea caraganae]
MSDHVTTPSLAPLAGLRVLELGGDVSLAFAARLLADLGAEVLRAAPPGGDAIRNAAPLTVGGSGLFTYLNHGKKEISAEPATLARLALQADLLLWAPEAEGSAAFRTAVPRQDEAARPPVIVFTAQGLTGARAGAPGNAFTAQHGGGFAWHQASPVSDPEGQPPLGCPDLEASMLIGLVGANAAMTALAEPRGETPPSWLDISAEDVFAWNLVDALAEYHDGVLTPGRQRTPGREITIAGGLIWLLPCADGTIVVSPREDHQWERWVELMGNPDWAKDPNLCGTRAVRTAHASEIGRYMRDWSVGVSARPIFEAAQAARVACFPVSTARDLLENRQLAARHFFRSWVLPDGVAVKMPGLPFTMRSSGGAALLRTSPIQPPVPADPCFATPHRDIVELPRARRHAPLAGIRVVDFSWVVAGPMATKMLGALGAEIIKIESSQRAEFAMRGGWFAGVNNNKRSCTIDITTEEGRALVRGLVAKSDIVVENFSARVLSKNGLAYEDLKAVRPDIVYVSASGLGREGPERDLVAYGSLLQCYSGRVGLIGKANPKLEAMGVMPAWTDPITSLWESFAILAALRHRAATGEGAYVDLSMLEATVALLPDALLHVALGRNPPRDGSAEDLGGAPSGLFRCAGDDAWLAVSVSGETSWRGLCRALGRADWAADADMASAEGRRNAAESLREDVAAWCRVRDALEAQAALRSHGVPAARSRGIVDLVEDVQLRQRGIYRQLANGAWSIALPWMDTDGWRGKLTPMPELGADNEYVFGEILGLNRERMAALKASGAIR